MILNQNIESNTLPVASFKPKGKIISTTRGVLSKIYQREESNLLTLIYKFEIRIILLYLASLTKMKFNEVNCARII